MIVFGKLGTGIQVKTKETFWWIKAVVFKKLKQAILEQLVSHFRIG
jgi:hypothetical protein